MYLVVNHPRKKVKAFGIDLLVGGNINICCNFFNKSVFDQQVGNNDLPLIYD
ncbi:hypothetical protein D3C87_1420050 [compost metagenome]